MNTYHLQGAVPLNSNAYIERPFEKIVLQEVLAGKWVLLLGPRQHGKTTGLIRIKKLLLEAGLFCVLIDLQSMPPCSDYGAVVGWFSDRVAEMLGSKTTGTWGYNLKKIRILLTKGLTDDDLRRLCFDEPDFRPVYEQLAPGIGKDSELAPVWWTGS
ncbi:MAG: AAA-like domain-containing protein [Rubrivivax sp.]|jgi:hypothetical protein|nr:AAA-like domain-containing protein [Rubrivivax sp.]